MPHNRIAAKVSSSRPIIEKLPDLVADTLNPPENALVVCVKESQVQTLERTQPMLPLGLGYVDGITHDYMRHGTTTFNGAVLAACKPRHRHQEFFAFRRAIDRAVPAGLDESMEGTMRIVSCLTAALLTFVEIAFLKASVSTRP